MQLYLGRSHASPNECHNSVSFDVKQLLSSSIAPRLSNGATTREANPAACASREASTIKASGVNRKWTNSGALGS